ncbi:MAG TPA: alpha/beta hydrolase [Bacillota bacterium]|nr:alpha/beta hydrolase [Bacillota bacterium]
MFTIEKYLDWFSFNPENVIHQIEWLDPNRTIMTQSFTPPSPIGTLLFVHGYFDHVGLQRHAITYFTQHGYRVLAFDLPGHGFSSGPRHSIEDFAEYVCSLHQIVQWAKQFSSDISLVAHSTGAAISLSYLCLYPNPFHHHIWVAPLVRSAGWGATQFFTPFIGMFAKRILRLSLSSSSDPEYRNRAKQDPFRGKYVPLDWIHALQKWNTTISQIQPMDIPVLILQGNQDRTVDWRYNIPFLQTKLPLAQVDIIPSAKHQLLNEVESIRTPIFERMLGYLQNERG